MWCLIKVWGSHGGVAAEWHCCWVCSSLQLHIQLHSVTSRRILTRSQSCDWTTCLAFLPSVNPACACRGLMSGNPQSHCFMRWVSFVISCVWMSSYVNVINEPVLVWWNSDPVVHVSLTFHHVACCTVGVKCEVWSCTNVVQSYCQFISDCTSHLFVTEARANL